MAKVRKTDPCPCGSGKKYKYCHGAPPEEIEAEVAPPRRQVFIWIVIALAPIAYAATFFQGEPADTTAERVWSEEHGHYHAADGSELPTETPAPTAATTTPAADGSSSPAVAPGPAPPGKIWSAEHGHWHNDPDADQQDAEPAFEEEGMPKHEYKLDRPPGPAPEGKVWSAAHGHWHDNDTP